MIKFFCSISLICFVITSFSQIKEKDVTGSWKVLYKNDSNHMWKLIRIYDNENDLLHFGTFIEFLHNNVYRQHASAPCGLDDDRYGFTGKWNLLANNRILLQINLDASFNCYRPNIYHTYTLLEKGAIDIISIQQDTLILHIIKNWEKISPKIKNR